MRNFEDHIKWMHVAIEEAGAGMRKGDGGPFGACVVKDNRLVASAHNTVLISQDPTAHAEVNAIRKACDALNTHILEDCILYTSSEPCPMCLGAVYWARVKEIYVGASRDLAHQCGFDDEVFYQEFGLPHKDRKIPFHHLELDTPCRKVFEEWQSLGGKLY